MSITYKFILNKRRQNKNGAYPLRVKLYQNSKAKELGLGISIPESDWDSENQLVKSSNLYHSVHNVKLCKVANTIKNELLLSELDINRVSSIDSIALLIKPKENKEDIYLSFIKYGEKCIKQLVEEGKAGNSIVYSCTINKLIAYRKSHKLNFDDITYRFLEGFRHSMLKEGIKVNTISIYLRTVRAIYNRAIREELIDGTKYPLRTLEYKTRVH